MAHEHDTVPPVKRALIKVMWLAGGVLMIASLIVIWWLLFPQAKLTYADGNATVSRDTVTAGETVLVTTPEFCNFGVETMLRRKIANETGALLIDPIEFYAPTGPTCLKERFFYVLIPAEVPPGQWRLIFESTYQANPVRSVTIEISTNYFTVVQPVETPR